MQARAKLGKSVYLKKTALRDSMNRFLVPSKDFIDSQSRCECGPQNAFTPQVKEQQGKNKFAERINLDSISKTKKIELLDFY